MAPSQPQTPPTPPLSALPRLPGSPTYSYTSTTAPLSTYNLPLPPPPPPTHSVLTKTDLENSQTSYATLLESAKSYRLALASLSTAAATFGSSLEACARLKEARSESLVGHGNGNLSHSFMLERGTCTADNLLSASGVHQLIANHQQILSETVYRSFEVPLLHELDGWRRRMEEEEISYQKEVKIRSKEIAKMEKEGLKLHRMRKRDVAKFRGHLVDLTTKLDDLTSLHGGHARSLLRDCQETSVKIVESSSSLVRAEVDIFEALARKGWSGGGLEELFEKGRDLFAADEDVEPGESIAASKLFSILPQKSILADTEGKHGGGTSGVSNRADSLLVDGDRYQSLAGAVREGKESADNCSLFSSGGLEGNFNKSRGVRPFSPPPPLTRANLTFGSGNPLEEAESKDRIQVKRGSNEDSTKLADNLAAAMLEDGEDIIGGSGQSSTSTVRGDGERGRRWSSATEDEATGR